MTCAVYIPLSSPDKASETFPTLLYLSGLTCTDENVCQKSGIFKKLSELRMGFVAPDTSPRNTGIPGETDSWDMGAGAGFYLDATAEPWAQHYKMYSYITKELMAVLKDNFAALDLTRMGVTGHSMGGHGALTIALKNQHMFKSVSAFAPICNPKVNVCFCHGSAFVDPYSCVNTNLFALLLSTRSSHHGVRRHLEPIWPIRSNSPTNTTLVCC